MRMLTRMAPSPVRHLKSRALFVAMVSVFFMAHSYAGEPEVTVTGCVVDFGGKRYKNIDVELKGLNYRGGAGYTNNNSVTLTDANGEFSVRMKAGKPPPGQPATAQVRATVKQPWGVHGWSGRASDVAQQINVSNIGKPVDLRPQGCLRYPWPISVGGEIASEELDERAHRSVSVRFTAGGSSDRLGVFLPNRRGGTSRVPFDFLVGLSEGDHYAVEIAEQPKGAHCEIRAGNSGIAGQSPTREGDHSSWVTNPIRIQCFKREIEPEEPRRDEESQEKPAALPRRVANSGSALFQDAIDSKVRGSAANTMGLPTEEGMTKSYEQKIATAQAQCAATESSCQKGCLGVAALGGLLSIFSGSSAGRSAGLGATGEQTQLCSNRCTEAKSSCDEQASGNQQGGSAVSARGLPVAECHRQANASDLGAKLNAIPRNDNVLLLRGSIYNLDFLIRTYTQCLPDSETKNAINGWETQREASLRTCRQISSGDNCLISPFGTTAGAKPVDPPRCYADGNRKCIGPLGCIQPPGGCFHYK